MSDGHPSSPVGRRGRIPGPRGLELWKFLLRFGECPHQRLLELVLKHGDIVQLKFPGEMVVVLARPEYIEHILHHRHQNYDKQTARYESARQVWGRGLLTADGDAWRRQRQRMQPAFHQEAVRQFAGIVVEEAQRILATWDETAARGETRDVFVDMLSCASRAITRASFGSDIDGKTDAINHALESVHDYINPMAPLNLLRVPHAIQRVVNPAYRRFAPAHRTLHGIFDAIVANRVASREPPRADLLGLMMAAVDEESPTRMTQAELHDEMMGILMAGHETTGIATAWTWYWLSRHSDIQGSLHAELDAVLAGRIPTYEDLAKLPYLQMVFQEAMRICPPVWGMDRRAREADEIDGFVIPREAKVAFSPYVMHHHPKYWNQPEAFDPTRFLPEQTASRPNYAYLPFGGGPRRCIGMRFAQLEGQLMIAILAQSFTVKLKPGWEVRPTARVNLQPRPGVEMLLERRRSGPAVASRPA